MQPTPTPQRAELTADPMRFGVGARVTAAVMRDDYATVIPAALAAVDPTGLAITTGDVSTWLGGDETSLLRWMTDFTGALLATGAHCSLTWQLSRGCPGEVECDLPGGAGPRGVPAPEGRETGGFAAAEWALYPLADTVVDGVAPDHMRDIYAAIELARGNGTFRGSEHYVTRLEGDPGVVLATIAAGWTMVGRSVQHVVSHATLSINSPSHRAGERA